MVVEPTLATTSVGAWGFVPWAALEHADKAKRQRVAAVVFVIAHSRCPVTL